MILAVISELYAVTSKNDNFYALNSRIFGEKNEKKQKVVLVPLGVLHFGCIGKHLNASNLCVRVTGVDFALKYLAGGGLYPRRIGGQKETTHNDSY